MCTPLRNSHLGQEEERGGFNPAVEFGIHSAGTCGCSAALSMTWQSAKLHCCYCQWQCGTWRVTGAMSTAKGSRPPALEAWEKHVEKVDCWWHPSFPCYKGQKKREAQFAFQAALVHSVLPFTLCQLEGRVESKTLKPVYYF